MSGKSSKLLIDEEPLQVLPTLATRLGLNRAMFLQQLHYWLKKPSAHERDGERWIYNTFEEWHEQFPFWSAEAIRKIASQLQKKGLIKTTSRYNERKGDRTLWYTINYEAFNALLEPPDESTKALDQPDKSTEQPDKSTELEPDKSTERYQRLPEKNNRDSDLQSGNGAKSTAPSKPISAKSFSISRLADFVKEAKAQGKQPVPLDEFYKRRFGDIYAAHLSDGWEVDDLDPALRYLVLAACGEAKESWLKGKKRWIPLVDAIEYAKRVASEAVPTRKPSPRVRMQSNAEVGI